jgi:methylglutaconyl-CoA hydratase
VSDDRVLHVSTSRGVATLTLDSPANRNALSRAMRAQLRTALAGALADDAVRVVVLDHTGRVFCSAWTSAEAAGGAAGDQGVRELPELLETVWRSPKPVVAVLRGPARAGGVGLAAACDVVVAASSATFAFSEVRLGIVPAVISAVVLPRMVPHVAHRLMLTGEVFDAAAAAAGGLVDLAVPDDDVDAAVSAQVTALAAGAPAALAETKRLLRAGGLRGSSDSCWSSRRGSSPARRGRRASRRSARSARPAGSPRPTEVLGRSDSAHRGKQSPSVRQVCPCPASSSGGRCPA